MTKYNQASLLLRDLVPKDQLVIVHADLGEVEWAGARVHVRFWVGDEGTTQPGGGHGNFCRIMQKIMTTKGEEPLMTPKEFAALSRTMGLHKGSASQEGLRLMLCEGLGPTEAAKQVNLPQQNMSRQRAKALSHIDDCKIIAGST